MPKYAVNAAWPASLYAESSVDDTGQWVVKADINGVNQHWQEIGGTTTTGLTSFPALDFAQMTPAQVAAMVAVILANGGQTLTDAFGVPIGVVFPV
jgi:hypothetical protein